MKKISRAVITSVMMFVATGVMFGQGEKPMHKGENKKEHFEKIEAAKREFFTQELKLTDKESEKFWAVYENFKKEEKANKKQKHELGRELRSKFDSIPEADVKTKTELLFKNEVQDVEIKQRYLNNAAEVIGYKRAAKSLYLEREFKRQLMERVEGKRPDKGPNPERGHHRPPPPPEEE